jgi:hypothetical protein
MSTPSSGDLVADIDDLMAALRAMWDERDPVPDDLAERVSFALSLENIEVELARMEEHLLAGAGARGEERVRTVTFTSASLSVMVTIGDEPAGTVRIDGWIQDGGSLDVEVRGEAGTRACRADGDGRFVLEGVVHGLVQLIFQPTAGGTPDLAAPVVTPALQV